MDAPSGVEERVADTPATPRRMYVIAGALALAVALTIGYGIHVTNEVLARHVPLIDAAMEIRLALSRAHAKHYRLSVGDTSVSPRQVAKHLREGQWYARAMQEGGEGAEGVFLPVTDSSMRRKAAEVLAELERLEAIVRAHPVSDTGAESQRIEQEHDSLLSRAAETAHDIERGAKALVTRRYQELRTIEITLMLTTAVVGLAVLLLLHAHGKRRTRELQSARQLNSDIAATNQQLQASEQQLRAANQQLKANEQQLRAANQQLKANEQQLRAANQQLTANEQQLRAANQQIRASEARYRSFAENLPGIAFQGGMDFIPLFFHGRVKEITGYEESDFVQGRPRWDQVVFPEDLGRFRETSLDLRDVPRVSLEREYRIVARNGDIRWVRESVQNVCDNTGRPRFVQGLIIDINDRRRAELALAAEQNRAREYLEIAKIMILALDAEGRVTMVNREGARVLGRREEEIVGADWIADFIPRRLREKVSEVFGRLMRGEIASGDYGENPVVTAAGEERLIAWYNTILRDEDGRIVGTLSSGEDITERRRAEEELQRRVDFEELTAALSSGFVHIAAGEIDESIDDALARVGEFMRVDRSYVFLYDGAGRTAGNTHEWCADGVPAQKGELQGLRVADFPLALGKVYEGESLVVHELDDIPAEWTAEKRVFREGGIRSLLCIPMKVRGRVIGFVGCDCVREQRTWSPDEFRMLRVVAEVMANALERKRAEEALVREHHLVTRLTDTSPVGVVQVDENGEVVFANKRAEAILGIVRPGLMGRAYNAPDWHITTVDGGVLPDEELPFSRIRATHRAIYGFRHAIEWPDGRRVLLSVSGAPLIGPGGRFEGGVFSIEDITERLRIEEELQKSQRLESLGLMAGGIAHDFNNLLGGLFGYFDMAREECRGECPAALEYLDKALKGYHRARDLTQQLLTFAKGGAPARRLASIAATVREAASLALSGSTVEPLYDVPHDLWDGEIDEGQISQVINNLVVNARHAMPQGGRLEISCRNKRIEEEGESPLAPGKYVEIEVADSGIGIPPEHLAKVFDPFFTTKQQGSGLGLATSYSIVKKHEGHMTVESELGRGTTFRLHLPASAQRSAVAAGAVEEEPVPGGGGRVLLMDDEEVIREMAQQLFPRLGYSVELTCRGEEAIEAYRAALEAGKPFDVVILDLTIAGGMGGLETIEALRKLDKNVTAVVSSGYAEDPVMSEPEAYGFKGVVRKPYRIRDLRSVLARTLS